MQKDHNKHKKEDMNTEKDNSNLKLKPNKNEAITNLVFSIIGFTVPLIIALIQKNETFSLNSTSFITAIILSIIGVSFALYSRSLTFFVLSVTFAPFYLFIFRIIGQINNYL